LVVAGVAACPPSLTHKPSDGSRGVASDLGGGVRSLGRLAAPSPRPNLPGALVALRRLGDDLQGILGGELELDPTRFATNGIRVAVHSDGLIAEGAFDRDHCGVPFQLLDAGRFGPPRDT
jgi:hypothetical protein